MVVVGATIVVVVIGVGAGAIVVRVGATMGEIVVVNVLVVVVIVGDTTGATGMGVGATGVTVGAMMGVIVVGKLLVIGATTGAAMGVIVVSGTIVVTGESVLSDGCFSVVDEVPVTMGVVAVPVFSGVRVAPDFVAGLMSAPERLFFAPSDSSTPALLGAFSAPFFIPGVSNSFLTVDVCKELAPPSSFSRAPGRICGSSLP